MAEITRTHGNAFGSVSHDRGTSSTGNISADELVTINGPVCNYFKIIIQDVSGDVNDLRPELGTGEVVEAVIKEINSKANVEAYQVEGDTTGQISVQISVASLYRPGHIGRSHDTHTRVQQEYDYKLLCRPLCVELIHCFGALGPQFTPPLQV